MRTILFRRTIGCHRSRLRRFAGLLAMVIGLFSSPSATLAGSATWDLNPDSGDWNTAANWTPATVPNGSADTATFGLSNITNVFISADTEVGEITFSPGATAYTITASLMAPKPTFRLTLSGVGITNNSSAIQTFVTSNTTSGHGNITFINDAAAGSSALFINNGTTSGARYGATYFKDNSSADSAKFINGGATVSGGGGLVYFANRSTAGNGTLGSGMLGKG